jgi:prenyl protein peptidase
MDGAEEGEGLRWACRCGGAFTLPVVALIPCLGDGSSHVAVIVSCDGCSLRIRVLGGGAASKSAKRVLAEDSSGSGAHIACKQHCIMEAPLRLAESIIVSVVLASTFVGAFYALPSSITRLPRDHPQHILARIAAVSAVCMLAPVPLMVLVQDGFVDSSASAMLGWTSNGGGAPCARGLHAWMPLAATAMLFFGPLAQSCLLWLAQWVSSYKQTDDPGTLVVRVLALPFAAAYALYQSLWAHANLVMLRAVIVAPISEEWVFRACVLPLFAMAGCGPMVSVPATCAVFGLAHVHHYFEHVRNGINPSVAVQRVLVQLSYTSLFGLYAGWTFYRTGSILVTVAVHSYCNACGLPDISFLLDKRHPLHPWRLAVLGLYLAGILAFARALSLQGTWGGRDVFPCALAFGFPASS